jgi:hypothetical protein
MGFCSDVPVVRTGDHCHADLRLGEPLDGAVSALACEGTRAGSVNNPYTNYGYAPGTDGYAAAYAANPSAFAMTPAQHANAVAAAMSQSRHGANGSSGGNAINASAFMSAVLTPMPGSDDSTFYSTGDMNVAPSTMDPNPSSSTGSSTDPSNGASSIANYGLANSPGANDCAPTAIQTILDATYGSGPDRSTVVGQVAATQGTSVSFVNTYGTNLGVDPIGGLYVNTVTTVLGEDGLPAEAEPNDGMPGLASNIVLSPGPAIIQVTFPNPNSTVPFYHSVTVQYQGGNILVNNLTSNGGTMNVSLNTFLSGQVSAGGTTYTLQPGIPTIVPIIGFP